MSEKKLFVYIEPLLGLMGKQINHIGNYGAGMMVKVLNNFIAASSVVSVRHVLQQAQKFELDIEALFKTIDTSSGQTWFGTNRRNIEWFKESFESNTINWIATENCNDNSNDFFTVTDGSDINSSYAFAATLENDEVAWEDFRLKFIEYGGPDGGDGGDGGGEGVGTVQRMSASLSVTFCEITTIRTNKGLCALSAYATGTMS